MTLPSVHISIVVRKGSPLDYQQYRHTAFWIRFSDGSPAMMIHITGTVGLFEFVAEEASDPTAITGFARKIDVGHLRVSATSAQVTRALEEVPINNRDREFNCQTWIEGALKMLADRGYLGKRDYEHGLNGMVDAIAEAEDEDE